MHDSSPEKAKEKVGEGVELGESHAVDSNR
jgi:hypothetical protein